MNWVLKDEQEFSGQRKFRGTIQADGTAFKNSLTLHLVWAAILSSPNGTESLPARLSCLLSEVLSGLWDRFLPSSRSCPQASPLASLCHSFVSRLLVAVSQGLVFFLAPHFEDEEADAQGGQEVA